MLTTVSALRDWSQKQHALGKRIGLVPTMGALHEGHLSLVRAAKEQCDEVVVSIFVNPTQFGPNEDFHRYPRPLENDLSLLETVGSPEVFVPCVEEMYPKGFDVTIHVGTRNGGCTEILEGRSRPTHFSGVATVVLKLFLASAADVAFFGQKDFQQAAVIKKMVADLNVPIDLVVCPIIRERDGLAMSSRNRYLSASQREQATALFRSLEEAARLIVSKKIRDAAVVKQAMRTIIETAPDAEIDYIALADPLTLRELDRLDQEEIVALLAVRFGSTRLIDNKIISRKQAT